MQFHFWAVLLDSIMLDFALISCYPPVLPILLELLCWWYALAVLDSLEILRLLGALAALGIPNAVRFRLVLFTVTLIALLGVARETFALFWVQRAAPAWSGRTSWRYRS